MCILTNPARKDSDQMHQQRCSVILLLFQVPPWHSNLQTGLKSRGVWPESVVKSRKLSRSRVWVTWTVINNLVKIIEVMMHLREVEITFVFNLSIAMKGNQVCALQGEDIQFLWTCCNAVGSNLVNSHPQLLRKNTHTHTCTNSPGWGGWRTLAILRQFSNRDKMTNMDLSMSFVPSLTPPPMQMHPPRCPAPLVLLGRSSDVLASLKLPSPPTQQGQNWLVRFRKYAFYLIILSLWIKCACIFITSALFFNNTTTVAPYFLGFFF